MAIYESATTNRYTLRLEVTETGTSVENNTSTLAWKLSIVSGSTYFSEVRIGAKVVIDGTTAINRAYSASSYYSLAKNSSVQIASGTVTVAHGANGAKTIAAGAITAQNTTQTGNICPNMSLSSGSALTLTTIPRKSTVAIAGGSTNLGTSRTITITPAATPTSFTHTVTWSFGSSSGTIATKTSSLSLSWTPAKSLASQIASGQTTKTGTITCRTYTGSTLIGESTASFTGKIPASEVSSSAANTKMGNVRTITIDRAASNLTHKITYTFGSASGTIASSAGTGVDWTVPKSLAAQVPTGNAQYSGTITCQTFNGSASCGTSTTTFLAKIPASAVAVPSAFTISTNAAITVTRAASNLTHKLTYSIGSTSNASIATGVGTSYAWPTPGTMVRQVPAGAVQAAGTVTCETFNGSASCGTTQASFTAKIPPDALSVDSTSVTLGGNRIFTTTLTDSGATNIKHKLTYTCGSATGTIKNPSATSETWTVPKSLAGQAAANASTVSISVTLATYNGTALVGSKQVTITGTIPASTIADHTFTIGQAGTVTISRAASNLSHIVTFDFGSLSNQTAVAKTTAASPTWTPPMSLCNQLPAAVSGTGTIKVTTYNGTTQIGSVQQATLTLKIPASVVPTDLSITTVIQNTNANLNSWGIAVAGYSTVKSTVAATSAYGSAITARKVTFGGQSGNAALSGGSYVWTSAKISESGSITPKLSVTDERGRTATKNGSAITVYAYAIPKVTQVSAYRSNSSGTKDKQGAYATVKLAGSVTSLGNRNTATLRARYKQASGGSWSGYTTLTNNTSKTINWSLLATVGYVVELSISDMVGNAVTRTISIPPDVVTLHMRQGGLGVGIGMYAQGNERLDVAWNTHFERVVRPNLLSSHDASASGSRSYAWICPRYTQTDLGISTEGSPFSTYLKAWIKKVCEDFAGRFDAPYLTIMGTANPGVRGFIVCNVNDPTDLSGGLPKYSSGAFYPTNGGTEVIRFGTWEYAFFYSVINGNETGSVTYASNSVITSAANLGVTLRKSGKVVTMDFAPTVAAVSTGSSTLKVAQIDDSSFYPQNRVALTVPQQASSFYYCGVYVTAAGEIQILKPNTSSTTVRANLSWITA